MHCSGCRIIVLESLKKDMRNLMTSSTTETKSEQAYGRHIPAVHVEHGLYPSILRPPGENGGHATTVRPTHRCRGSLCSPGLFHFYSPETSNESEQLRNVTAKYEKYKQKVEELKKAAKSPRADHIPLWVQELPYKEFPALLMEIMGDVSQKHITIQLLDRLAWCAARDEDIPDSHNNLMPVDKLGMLR
jgi:hypothetical protein